MIALTQLPAKKNVAMPYTLTSGNAHKLIVFSVPDCFVCHNSVHIEQHSKKLFSLGNKNTKMLENTNYTVKTR